MKFEKFVKKAVPYCSTVIYKGINWCKFGSMYARIPGYIGQIGSVDKYDEILPAVLDAERYEEKAELIRAYLLDADGKAKDIIREFSDGDLNFDISNDQFALIERYDELHIIEVETDTLSGMAMMVGKPVSDPDNYEPDLIFTRIEKEENKDE